MSCNAMNPCNWGLNRFKVVWIEEIKGKAWERDQKRCNRRLAKFWIEHHIGISCYLGAIF